MILMIFNIKQFIKMAAGHLQAVVHKWLWGNLVTIYRVNLTEYVVEKLFITILDDFDDIRHQTVFQNGRWPPLGSCP